MLKSPLVAKLVRLKIKFFKKELERIEKLKIAVKNREMIYQADLKEGVAKDTGLSFDYLATLPFSKWVKIRDSRRARNEIIS